MLDKPILDYASRNSAPSLLWVSATALPEFAFGVFVGGFSGLFFLQYIRTDTPSQANGFSVLLSVAANTLVTMAIACVVVWITRVLAEMRHPRQPRTFRVKTAIGFGYFWATHFANIAWGILLVNFNPSLDLRMLLLCSFADIILFAIIAGLILSPK